MYETFEHTADAGLRVTAGTLNELFEEAARGLFSMIVENYDRVRPVRQIQVLLEGDDNSYLLFDWLNELLYEFDTEHLVFSSFKVNITGGVLTAQAGGERIDPSRHVLDHEIKAITYHELKVEKTGDGWLAEMILDI